ncbi:hypothetical protein Drorol1_Dr00004915 [Drosera rotundifolia]
MSEYSPFLNTNRYAVVTGANKGIGFEICKQLASHDGVTVILTARDPTRGREAVERLSQCPGLAGRLLFHQLDVADAASVAALAGFVNSEFGRLDILVNNAAIGGAEVDADALKARMAASQGAGGNLLDGITVQTYERAEACLNTNYYGVKRMIEAFIPLLELSDSPRIVNVSSRMGLLKNINNEWAKGIFIKAENHTEEEVDEVVKVFLQDFKEGSHTEKGWPQTGCAYIVSKAALNAYTRVVAKKYPTLGINCVCPGYVKTDLNFNTGVLTLEEGAETPVMSTMLPFRESISKVKLLKLRLKWIRLFSWELRPKYMK